MRGWNSKILKNKYKHRDSNFLVVFSFSKAQRAIERGEGTTHWCWLAELDRHHNQFINIKCQRLFCLCSSHHVPSVHPVCEASPEGWWQWQLSILYACLYDSAAENQQRQHQDYTGGLWEQNGGVSQTQSRWVPTIWRVLYAPYLHD